MARASSDLFVLLPLAVETFKNQKLPLARIKKIMKADEDVRVSGAAINLSCR